MAYWTDIDGKQNEFEKCECSKLGNCHASTEENFCNCDALPSVHSWLKDTVKITNLTLLPIKMLKYGYLRSKANFSVGRLYCKGGPNPVDIE